MIFRNIILNALFAGLLAGLLLSVLQLVGVSPIIIAAETFEQVDATPLTEVTAVAELPSVVIAEAVVDDHSAHDHDHGVKALVSDVAVSTEQPPVLKQPAEAAANDDGHTGHSHNAEAWTPADGAERTFYTFTSNILAAIGFAAVLLALMVQTHTQGLTRITPLKGVAWGVAGFLALFVVPALGLPPEIPGMEAAAIENRQGWWMLAVSTAIAGLACLAFAPIKLKALGLLMMAVPYLVGAPHPLGPAISHPDAQAVTALTQLHADFVMASAMANLVFWLVLGLLSAYLLSRKLLAEDASEVGV